MDPSENIAADQFQNLSISKRIKPSQTSASPSFGHQQSPQPQNRVTDFSISHHHAFNCITQTDSPSTEMRNNVFQPNKEIPDPSQNVSDQFQLSSAKPNAINLKIAKEPSILEEKHGKFESNNQEQNPRNPLKDYWHKCSFGDCEKVFKFASQLKLHVVRHYGVRPYICNFENCGKSFTSSCNLYQHEKIHTGERKYVCQTCDKAFLFRHHLRQHNKICEN